MNTPMKQLVINFFDTVFCRHDLTSLEEFLHADYIQHDYDVPSGIDGFRNHFENIFRMFPDFQVRIKHIIEENDMLAVHGYGITVPGEIEVLLVDTYRTRDGLLYEHWGTVQSLPKEQFGNPRLL